MPHFQDDIQDGWWLTVEYENGESEIHATAASPLSLSPIQEHDLDSVCKMTLEQGWSARLDAPGYIDCTDWEGVYRTHDEAAAALDESFGTKCCYCGVRVGAGNTDAPCDGCLQHASWSEGGLHRIDEDDVVIADQAWTTRWGQGDYSDGAWPCSTLAGGWAVFWDDGEGWYLFGCEGGLDHIDGSEAQAMSEDIERIVAAHYEEVDA